MTELSVSLPGNRRFTSAASERLRTVLGQFASTYPAGTDEAVRRIQMQRGNPADTFSMDDSLLALFVPDAMADAAKRYIEEAFAQVSPLIEEEASSDFPST